MPQIRNIQTHFPTAHPLVMARPTVFLAHAFWISDKERFDALVTAKVDGFTSSFMPQISYSPGAHRRSFTPGTLQFAVTARPFLTTRSFSRYLPKLFG